MISFENSHIENIIVHVLKLPVLVKNATFPLKIASIHRIKALIKKIKPDLLHAHYITNYGFFGALCNFKPFIVTTWGSDILTVPGEHGLSTIKKYIAKYVLRKTDVVTCDAEHMKENLKRLGAIPEKISIIYFGIDTNKFSPRQKNNGFGMKVVISLRNLEPLYDVESLIKAAPLVLKEIPETKFVIVGRGSEQKRLRQLAKSLDVADNVNFTGFVPNEQIPQYLANADIYVSTSLSDAGIAASTAEAMACELPVIVTDVADNRKWIDDGVNGFVVPIRDPQSLAEKIVYLLQNAKARNQFGTVNREIIEKRNNYHKEMKKMEDIYEELVQRREK